ncbi:hypothetical protein ES703_52096 [subsurface metagenome]
MDNKKFVTKLRILELIDEIEVIELMTLVNHLNMSFHAAEMAIWRLKRAGYVEPLTSEEGRCVLTNKGYDYLDFLRRRRDGKR